MLKRNDGYFLTESIIVLTIIATIITTLYINSMNFYAKQTNKINKFNTVQGLYNVKEVVKYYSNNPIENIDEELIYDSTLNNNSFFKSLDINKIYYTDYVITDDVYSKLPDYVSNQLNEIDTSDQMYKNRYIVIFNDDSFASIATN